MSSKRTLLGSKNQTSRPSVSDLKKKKKTRPAKIVHNKVTNLTHPRSDRSPAVLPSRPKEANQQKLSTVLATVPKTPSAASVAVAHQILKNASQPVKGAVSLRSHPVEEHEHREERKIGLGDPNKVGRNIDKLNHYKNLSPVPQEQKALSSNNAINKLMKAMDPKVLLSPDCQRYCALLERPLTAPWGDEGEVQVKPLLYDTIVPPSSTATCRQYGQMYVSVPPNGSAWVVLCIGAGNMIDISTDPEADTLLHSAPVAFYGAGFSGTLLATPGAPNDTRALVANGVAGVQGGRGIAGYWYATNAAGISDAPIVDQAAMQVSHLAATGTDFGEGNLLQWGSPPPFDQMDAFDSSQYKYRPIAGGIQITPADAELAVGGVYNVSIVPQATNEIYARVPLIPAAGNGKSTSASDIFALPDHAVTRADGTCEVAWLPSRMDYSFLQTGGRSLADDSSQGAGSLGQFALFQKENTEVPNARVFIQITPPFNSAGAGETSEWHNFVISYVGFYEVAGRCIQTQGVVPRPQPSLGAKVATSVQNSLNLELKERSSQISKGTSFEVMKDHPKVGPMIEKVESHEEVKGVFEEIMGFAKEIVPIAGMIGAML